MRAAALGLGVLAALAAAASPAAAATIVTGTGCYPTGGDISVAGQGFAPGSLVTVTGPGVEGRAFADSSGNVQVMAAGQPLSTRVPIARAITLTASDGAAAAQTMVRVTNFTFSIAPAVRHPDTPVRWRVSGFAPRDRVYAHYVHAGRERRRVLLGRMPSPCSILRAQVPMLPIQHPARGRWTIQLDASPRYHADTSPRLRLAGTIRRR
ncbi:MAG: hypothetical protein JWP17_2076 [Solirubrobacterales bacterium]|jgi:hypothetical protein|nr:hypothetical protein [Solirubrobacterales bacterium]